MSLSSDLVTEIETTEARLAEIDEQVRALQTESANLRARLPEAKANLKFVKEKLIVEDIK